MFGGRYAFGGVDSVFVPASGLSLLPEQFSVVQCTELLTSSAEHYRYICLLRLISYRRFIAIRYKFKCSTYIQEPLVIGRRGCVQREI
jgi:hypothetical protein